MKVITITNRRGGTGKTTLSATLAAGLALRGQRVLLIDADPQGSLSSWLGGGEVDSMFQLLYYNKTWQDVLVGVPAACLSAGEEVSGYVFLLRSNETTGVITSLVKNPQALELRLDEVKGSFDFCVIDTSPSFSDLKSFVYKASDFVIIPVTIDADSFIGAGHTKNEAIDAGTQRNRPLPVIGLVPVRMDARKVADNAGYAFLQAQYEGEVWKPITERVAWRESRAARMTIFAYQNEDSRHVQEANMFVDRVMEATRA